MRKAAGITQSALAAHLQGRGHTIRQCDISMLETGQSELTPELYHLLSLAVLELKRERDARFELLAKGGGE